MGKIFAIQACVMTVETAGYLSDILDFNCFNFCSLNSIVSPCPSTEGDRELLPFRFLIMMSFHVLISPLCLFPNINFAAVGSGGEAHLGWGQRGGQQMVMALFCVWYFGGSERAIQFRRLFRQSDNSATSLPDLC